MKRQFSYFVVSLCLSGAAMADVSLPALFSDGMVIQSGAKAPIWGTASAGENISIECQWLKEKVHVTADDRGRWHAVLQSPDSAGPFTIRIKGRNEVVISNVLCGQVWVCAGQSNMQMSLKRTEGAEKEIASSAQPQIRLFTVGMRISDERSSTCKGSWQECSAVSSAEFSAIGYYFARSLHARLNVPIGMIEVDWGGAPAESFVSMETLSGDPDLVWYVDRWKRWESEKPLAQEKYAAALARYEQASKDANDSGKPVTVKKPVQPRSLYCLERPFRRPSAIFNGMVSPVMGYAIKGVIWYQGESNKDKADTYEKLFSAVISDWRRGWGQGDFPFYYVQLAPFASKEDPEGRSLVQDAQLRAMKIPNTGIVSSLDVGDPANLHPVNKKPLGERLALWAMARTYGKADVICSGPLYKSVRVDGSRLVISFDNTGAGLTVGGSDRMPGNFTIAGEDKKFVPAKAKIEGDRVVVWNDSLEHPIAARYCWGPGDQATLFNKEGLPATVFRTDNW